MSDEVLALTKQAIGEILAKLNIVKVVYVDDMFEENIQTEKVIGWVAEAYGKSPIETQEIVPEIALDQPDDVRYQRFNDFWENADAQKKQLIITRVLQVNNLRLAEDFGTTDKVKTLFPRKVDFAELSPSAWQQQQEQILQQASSERRILCLFDQDLSESSGFTEEGAKSGIGLIQAVIQQGLGDNVTCGLLTHTIPSLEAEMPRWRELATQNGLELWQFLPLAKVRVTDPNHLLFADGIKKTVLNTFCEKLKSG